MFYYLINVSMIPENLNEWKLNPLPTSLKFSKQNIVQNLEQIPTKNQENIKIAQEWTNDEIINMIQESWFIMTDDLLEPILWLIYHSKDDKLGSIVVDYLLKWDVLNLCWFSEFNFANKIKYLPISSMTKFIEWVKKANINLLAYTQAAIIEMWEDYANLIFKHFNKDDVLNAMKYYNETVVRNYWWSHYTSVR